MFLTSSREADNPIGIITPEPVGALYVSMSSRKNRSATGKSDGIKTRSLAGLTVNICANSVTWTLLEAGKIKNKKKRGKKKSKSD
jgi:hypothetical protein